MIAPAEHVCPVCRANDCEDLGAIYHYRPHRVAGVDIDLHDIDFHLRRCRACQFQFKDPPIPEAKLLECYAKADEGNWSLNPDPKARYFDLFKQMLERHSPGPRVLDIGCFNGALLQYLGPKWQPFGVEPSERAANLAAQRGVKILGSTLDDIPENFEPFDAIIAIDVLEHIVEPMPFFARVRDLLRPGGIFLGFTGDTGALAWKLNRSRYWYNSLPEHVSFFSRETMNFIGNKFDMPSIEHRHLSHQRTTARRKLDEVIKNVGFIAGTKAGWLGIPSLRRKMNRSSPMWFASRDHMLHVMRRT